MENKQFISEEYEQEKYVLNMIWFTIFSLIILVFFTLIFGIPFYNAWKINNNENIFPIIINTNYRIIFLIICILGLFIHELIHGFFWGLFVKNKFKGIKIYFHKKYYTFVCECKNVLNKRQFIIGTIMPMIILGFIPLVLSFIFLNRPMFIFGILYTAAAGGDILIIFKILLDNKIKWIKSSDDGILILYKKNNE